MRLLPLEHSKRLGAPVSYLASIFFCPRWAMQCLTTKLGRNTHTRSRNMDNLIWQAKYEPESCKLPRTCSKYCAALTELFHVLYCTYLSRAVIPLPLSTSAVPFLLQLVLPTASKSPRLPTAFSPAACGTRRP